MRRVRVFFLLFAPGDALQLLTTPPKKLRAHFGWDAGNRDGGDDKAFAIWGALRKGLNVLDADECASTKYVSKRLHRQLLDSDISAISPVVQQASSVSEDGTEKLLLMLPDGLSVECVVLPMLGGKHTSLCVSSQVGCSRACTFCSTGTMGLIRNLTTEEILAQVWMGLRAARERGLPRLVNIIFMGMGEPLNNFDHVKEAVDILVDPGTFAFSRRNICVSSVGPSPHLIKKMGELPCKLAWSVHAADDELRKLLVPTTRHTMEELRDAFLDALAVKPGGPRVKGLLVELALMRNVNDQPEHARQLVELLKPFKRGDVLVNLIPYNENGLSVGGALIQQSRQDDVHAFQRSMWNEGILCTVRATRGETESSACGMLATQVARKTKKEGRAAVMA